MTIEPTAGTNPIVSITSPEKALALMNLSMPSFESFLEHGTSLKAECEKAGELTPARAALFDQYKEALLAAREEYENTVAQLICAELSSEDVDLLIAFYAGPTHKAVEKALGLSAVVNNIGTAWQTKVLERCPETWKMLMENIGEWQRKNTPEDWDVITPDAPPSADGWKRVETTPQTASEYVPEAPVEEVELERLRAG